MNIKYGILLTKEQLDFLKDDNQGFLILKRLVKMCAAFNLTG